MIFRIQLYLDETSLKKQNRKKLKVLKRQKRYILYVNMYYIKTKQTIIKKDS